MDSEAALAFQPRKSWQPSMGMRIPMPIKFHPLESLNPISPPIPLCIFLSRRRRHSSILHQSQSIAQGQSHNYTATHAGLKHSGVGKIQNSAAAAAAVNTFYTFYRNATAVATANANYPHQNHVKGRFSSRVTPNNNYYTIGNGGSHLNHAQQQHGQMTERMPLSNLEREWMTSFERE